MDIDTDIAQLIAQELSLVFPAFDLHTAWQLGTRLREVALARGVAITIEVRLVRDTAFFCAMPGTTPENADWARRKRNLVELQQRSSYILGLELKRAGTTVADKFGLAPRDHVAAGGCVPVRVAGVGCVGTATVSGLPQREDHELVVQVMAELCGAAGAAKAG